MAIKLGEVTQIVTRSTTYNQQTIKFNDGSFAMFFSDVGFYNKSLKVGDKVRVFYKQTLLGGFLPVRVIKDKNENILRLA